MQFEMPLKTKDERRRYQALAPFIQGYLAGAWFTLDDELQPKTFADLSPHGLAQAIDDCVAFRDANADWLLSAYVKTKDLYCPFTAGLDFWLTRNGAGAGYWDRGLGDIGDALTKAAEATGRRALYQGDDKQLYFGKG